MTAIRLDHRIIADIVEPGSRVLDLGCGSGELLKYIADTKHARVQGIELDEAAIYKCVEKGLSVFQSDIDSGLKGYPDKAFDYIILNQSIQQIKNVDFVIDESLRTGKKVIVGFPNFAYITSRLKLFLGGRSPITANLPYQWHNTPNLRFLSIKDFQDYCREKNLTVFRSVYIGNRACVPCFPNLFAKHAIFVVARRAG